MMNYNLAGRLTKDVDFSDSGSVSVAKVSVAVNYTAGKKKETDFFNLTAFGKNAENISKFFHKGDGIIVSGTVRNNNYTKDGKTVYRDSYVIEKWEFPPTRKSSSGTQESGSYTGFMDLPEDEDLPFN